MDFDLRFEFADVGGLIFLRYRSRAKRLRVPVFGVNCLVEEYMGKRLFYLVLYRDWACFLPVLLKFSVDSVFDCVVCGCYLSSENRSEAVNVCSDCYDSLED
jgi:hypothetical protein